MNPRELFEQNPALARGLACGLAALAVLVLAWNLLPAGSGLLTERWGFDAGAGTLVRVPVEAAGASPLPAVVVLSCGGCGGLEAGMRPEEVEGEGAKIAYFVKYGGDGSQPEAVAAFDPAGPQRWLAPASGEGIRVQGDASVDCEGDAWPTSCVPG